MKLITPQIIVDVASPYPERIQIHVDPSESLEVTSTFNSMGKGVELTKVSDMCMPAKELNWDGGMMCSNGRQDDIELGACDVAKGGVTYDNDEVDIACFVTEDGLEPILLDECFDRLAGRNEFVVA